MHRYKKGTFKSITVKMRSHLTDVFCIFKPRADNCF